VSQKRGAALEVAIARGGSHYARVGRARIVRQHPPVANDANGVFYAGHAPIDFLGALAGGQMLALEAKQQHGQSWPIANLRDDQRDAMRAFHELGADVRLVLDFLDRHEVFSIAWPTLAAFLDAPPRESLTITWCRAHGLLMREETAHDADRRRVLFLDAVPHPNKHEAIALLARAVTRKTIAATETKTFGDDAAPLSVEERRARTERALLDGIERQLSRPRRSFRPFNIKTKR
jgi:penicillin-binding protein-related factor A (putative recombinase)